LPLKSAGSAPIASRRLRLNQGHPRIAGAILGHWKFAPAIVSAVSNQNLALNTADCKRLLSTTAQQIKSLHSALVG
jgi:hypothetical protein